MSTPANHRMIASCSCGSVEIEALGAPITSIVCYCDDCHEGARRIEALPHAGPVRDPDGGAAYVVYRKDRVACSKGAQLLKHHKLRETSPTSRVVATCCNSAMFLGFDDGKHWVDVYRSRIRGDAPPVQMRICTRFKPEDANLPSDVPSHPAYPVSFLVKLLAARVAMLFRR